MILGISVVNILQIVGLIILGLSIMVTIHELGHHLTAKMFGMKVEKFSVGFPPKVFSFMWRGTEYQIGAVPLGGFVKIAGIIDESMDAKNMQKDPEAWEFRAKPVWQRLIVMSGGVIMNIILGILIFSIIKFAYGDEKLPMEEAKFGIDVYDKSTAQELGFKTGDKIVNFKGEPIKYFDDISSPNILLEEDAYFELERNGEKIRIDIPSDFIDKYTSKEKKDPLLFYPNTESFVVTDSASKLPAYKAGIRKGDRIIEIENKPVEYFGDIRKILKGKKNEKVDITVLRNEVKKKLVVQLDSNGKMGVAPDVSRFKYETLDYGFFQSFGVGTKAAFSFLWTNIQGFKKLLTGKINPTKGLQGPVGIAVTYGTIFDRLGWLGFWQLTAMLSMILAFMNFLPIPALDGGHIVFLLLEAISGKEPSLKFRMIAQQVGMVILLLLMAFVIFNDIWKMF